MIALHLKDGGRLWLMPEKGRPESPLFLLKSALYAMKRSVPENARFVSSISSVIVPAINIDAAANTEWVQGLQLKSRTLSRVTQQVKIRLNPRRLPVRSDRILATRRNRYLSPLVVNQPVIGWFTQEGSRLPEGVFYSHPNSWEGVT